jgi:hypothetical protein
MSAALAELRQALERRFPDALPLGRSLAPAVATGIAALDAMLPGQGLARGRLTAWRPGGGATAVLRAACESAVGRGERSAWVDIGHVQSAEFWRAGPLLVRPATEREGLAAAEELLRCGGVPLVVVSGGDRETMREAVRLSRAAKAGGASLVLLATDTTVAHLRVSSRIPVSGYRWRRDPFGSPVEVVAVRVEIEAASLGWGGRTAFELPVRFHAARAAPEPRLVDRRGALPAARWPRRAPTKEGT